MAECIKKKFSLKSMEKIQTQLDDPAQMAKCLVEAAAVSTAGEAFCKATYFLESDKPMALTTHLIFDRIENGVQPPSSFSVFLSLVLG